MFSALTSFGFLTTGVQSVVTNVEQCFYSSRDGTCTVDQYTVCDNTLCTLLGICDYVRCAGVQAAMGMSFGNCIGDDDGGIDEMVTCTDDGTAPEGCSNYDLCFKECYGSPDCDGAACFTHGANVDTYGAESCDQALDALITLKANFNADFESFGQCFANPITGRTEMITCDMGGSDMGGSHSSDDNAVDMGGSSSSDDNAMIIGIVIGAVVLVGCIVGVVICRRSKKNL